MTESDFEAKPSVLLLGQYSTGKTTFIKYLLGREEGYPGEQHTAPDTHLHLPSGGRSIACRLGQQWHQGELCFVQALKF